MLFSQESLFIVILTTTFILYASTSFPSITGGDTGELLAEACQLGVAHPPGYPLFLMLNHLAMRVADILAPGAAGAPAFAANLLSCAFGALAAAMAAIAVHEWSGSQRMTSSVPEAATAGGIVAAALFALSPLTWEYSTGSEVFALNNALMAVLIWLTAKVGTAMHSEASTTTLSKSSAALSPQNESPWSIHIALALPWARAGALVSGLALANQHTALLFVVPLVATVLVWLVPPKPSQAAGTPLLASLPSKSTHDDFKSFTWQLVGLAIFFMLGLGPYAYLVVAAQKHTVNGSAPPGSWGDTGTLAGFWKHVTRGEYGTFTMLTFGAKHGTSRTTESAWERAVLWLQDASLQTSGAGPLLAAMSVITALIVFVMATMASKPSPPPQQSISTTKKNKSKKEKLNVADNAGTVTESVSTLAETKVETTSSMTAYDQVALAFVTTLLFYTLIWNSIFSNLPLTNNPMARAVHSRFWMQPNLLLSVLAGDGFAFLLASFLSLSDTALRKAKFLNSSTSTRRVRHYVVATAAVVGVVMYSGRAGWAHAKSRLRFGFGFGFGDDGHGLTMHRYGESLLATLPTNALLISHTDLDWNTVRYLRTCERRRPDIVHLSAQLLPYPWFERQHAAYPNVTFPPLFPGVSTHKRDNANGQLLEDFIFANYAIFGGSDEAGNALGSNHNKKKKKKRKKKSIGATADASDLDSHGGSSSSVGGGIFLDLQAVDESLLGSRGAWRSNLVLIPHGPLYRVFKKPTESELLLSAPPASTSMSSSPSQEGTLSTSSVTTSSAVPMTPRALELALFGQWAKEGAQALKRANDAWLPLGPPPKGRWDPGSWEKAATSVYWDAHYQLSLFALSLGIDLSEGATPSDVPMLIGCFAAAAHLLDLVIKSAVDVGGKDYEKGNNKEVNKHAITLSSSRQDVVKNAALAHVRLQSVASIATKFPQFQQLDASMDSADAPTSTRSESANDTILVQCLRGDLPALSALVLSEQGEMSVTQGALQTVVRFLAEQPGDRDAAVFKHAKDSYAKLLQDRQGISKNNEALLQSSHAKESTNVDAAASSTKKKKRRKKKSNEANKGSRSSKSEL